MPSNWEYRQSLQNDSNHLIKQNSLAAVRELGLDPYLKNLPFNKHSDLLTDYNTKFQFKSRMIAPTININSITGVHKQR
jgi:hypothetical protein